MGTAIYLLTLLADMLFFNQMRKFWFSSLSYLVGNIILLILIIIFFLVSQTGTTTYQGNMMFWTCTGLLVFYLGSLPFYGLWNTLARDCGHFQCILDYPGFVQLSDVYFLHNCFHMGQTEMILFLVLMSLVVMIIQYRRKILHEKEKEEIEKLASA